MSRLVSRILLTVLLFPSATLVLFLSFLFIDQLTRIRNADAAVLATFATCAYMAGYWLLLWRTGVNWTGERFGKTLIMTMVATVAGVAMGFSIGIAMPHNNDELATCGGALTGVLVWIILTIFAWRETPAERAQRISRAGADTLVCPACGYNLTGLREARCPECGAQYTLNELLAAQPERAGSAVEIER